MASTLAHSDDGNAPPSSTDGRDTSETPAKRKRGSGASSRGVAHLTPLQLDRKRKNDREAQRNIRQRTKDHISSLEAEIRALRSGQEYHELQAALAQKEAVEAENADLKRRLAQVHQMTQPLQETQGLNELAAAAERSPLPVQYTDQDPRGNLHEFQHPSDQLQSPEGHVSANRNWNAPGDHPVSHIRNDNSWAQVANFAGDTSRPASNIAPELSLPNDQRLDVNFLIDSNNSRVLKPNGVASGVRSSYITTLPQNLPPACPLDGVLHDFLLKQQHLAQSGVPPKSLAGPEYPNFSPLLNPSTEKYSHALSHIVTNILRTFPDLTGLPEKVAVAYVMFLIMRWCVDPSPETYDKLPHWMTPRPSQLFTPHPYWIDYLPWPMLRDRLTTSGGGIFPSFEEWFIPYTTTLSLNWPYDDHHCLLPAPPASSTSPQSQSSSPQTTAGANQAGQTNLSPGPAGGLAAPEDEPQWIINPVFESHLRDLGNWSLGVKFREAFPELADVVRIHEKRRR
ncbi:hypothetical protein K402DRAFT_397503 [Aulographum hederae CBS 113979]|uniref:BZIP domain-containing protein n=1 Tax=Aulographum hederae CBS 113979 TaxID=1176131 RepID=A0A6G1GNA5_9PEZI|nr:hypothetical protein K402DRAFT_397503 [Aulographum hederae CBS 113979]